MMWLRAPATNRAVGRGCAGATRASVAPAPDAAARAFSGLRLSGGVPASWRGEDDGQGMAKSALPDRPTREDWAKGLLHCTGPASHSLAAAATEAPLADRHWAMPPPMLSLTEATLSAELVRLEVQEAAAAAEVACLAHPDEPADELNCSSVLKKRRAKIKKHWLKKRRRRDRYKAAKK